MLDDYLPFIKKSDGAANQNRKSFRLRKREIKIINSFYNYANMKKIEDFHVQKQENIVSARINTLPRQQFRIRSDPKINPLVSSRVDSVKLDSQRGILRSVEKSIKMSLYGEPLYENSDKNTQRSLIHSQTLSQAETQQKIDLEQIIRTLPSQDEIVMTGFIKDELNSSTIIHQDSQVLIQDMTLNSKQVTQESKTDDSQINIVTSPIDSTNKQIKQDSQNKIKERQNKNRRQSKLAVEQKNDDLDVSQLSQYIHESMKEWKEPDVIVERRKREIQQLEDQVQQIKNRSEQFVYVDDLERYKRPNQQQQSRAQSIQSIQVDYQQQRKSLVDVEVLEQENNPIGSQTQSPKKQEQKYEQRNEQTNLLSIRVLDKQVTEQSQVPIISLANISQLNTNRNSNSNRHPPVPSMESLAIPTENQIDQEPPKSIRSTLHLKLEKIQQNLNQYNKGDFIDFMLKQDCIYDADFDKYKLSLCDNYFQIPGYLENDEQIILQNLKHWSKLNKQNTRVINKQQKILKKLHSENNSDISDIKDDLSDT
ncbi:hypothetical protein pb186bvf_007704 [Paramecium bursaria]